MAVAAQGRSAFDSRGRQADSPEKIPARGWMDILWRVFRSINEDRVLLIAAGVTYYLLLALVPSLSAFVSLYGLFNDPATVNAHVNLLSGIVPPGGLEIIKDQLTRLTSTGKTTLGFTFFISLVIALWSASSGMQALFDAMNIAYEEEEKRNFFVRTGLALLFTLGAAVTAVIFLGAVVVVPVVLALFHFGAGFDWLIRIVSYGLMLAVMLLAIGVLYRWGPSRKQAKWRWITPGAVLAVIGIGIVSLLFSWYASSFSDYNATYGSLGAVIGLMTWIWLSVTVLIIGAELNSELEHQTARDSTTGSELPMGQRGAFMADHVASNGDARSGDGESFHNGSGRHRLSLGTLALALPAALVIDWAKRRNSGHRPQR
ncbi:MAG TPA: YihY/virulence factor BrkB family protein [Arsenicitalea sp.]|nr:YihY/virulence factor BrkB family protein [Arsenicitalea sp.]